MDNIQLKSKRQQGFQMIQSTVESVAGVAGKCPCCEYNLEASYYREPDTVPPVVDERSSMHRNATPIKSRKVPPPPEVTMPPQSPLSRESRPVLRSRPEKARSSSLDSRQNRRMPSDSSSDAAKTSKMEKGSVCQLCHCQECYDKFIAKKKVVKQRQQQPRPLIQEQKRPVQRSRLQQRFMASPGGGQVRPWSNDWFGELVKFRKENFWDTHGEGMTLMNKI